MSATHPLLRALQNVHVDNSKLLVYKCVIESSIFLSSMVWFREIECKDKTTMKNFVKKNADRLKANTAPLDDQYNCNRKQVNKLKRRKSSIKL